MRYVLDKSCREAVFNNYYFENRAVYEIMSKNMEEPGGSQMTSQYGAYELHAG
jgi:hypothetical protein